MTRLEIAALIAAHSDMNVEYCFRRAEEILEKEAAWQRSEAAAAKEAIERMKEENREFIDEWRAKNKAKVEE